MRARRILLLAAPGTQILDLVGPYQVFVRAAEIIAVHNGGEPVYQVEVITTEPGLLQTNCGIRLEGHRTYRQIRRPVDTLLIAGGGAVEDGVEDPKLVEWLRQISAQTRRIGSICTGAFLLAQAGLLDNRRATTHWKYCEAITRQYPSVKIDPDPIFVRDGNVYTSAGVTAGMDMSLALVEEDFGSAIALEVARELVLYLRRPGGQSQFSAALALQSSEKEPFRELGAWVLEHLNRNLSVEELARHVGMSSRNFARLFRQEMSMTPAKFVETFRIDTARRRLQESSASLGTIATSCGFRSADRMRSAFNRVLGVSPGEYRQRFQGKHVAAAAKG
jgi:transcriptional regulator GlxA family with amidase domain